MMSQPWRWLSVVLEINKIALDHFDSMTQLSITLSIILVL